MKKKGAILYLEPKFDVIGKKKNRESSILFNIFKKYKSYYFILIFILFISLVFLAINPLFNRLLYDKGLGLHNINTINLIIFSQLIIQIFTFINNISKEWLKLNLSNTILRKITREFSAKLLKLDYNFFKTRHSGDILTRLEDVNNIERYALNDVLNLIYSILVIIIFGLIIYFIDPFLLLVYFVFSIAYTFNLFLFTNIIKNADVKLVHYKTRIKGIVIDVFNNITDIKIFNLDKNIKQNWNTKYDVLLKQTIKLKKITTIQSGISGFLISALSLYVTWYLAHKLVAGEISFGYMIAINIFIGLLTSPFRSILNFYQRTIITKLSLSRINQLFKPKKHHKVEQQKNALNFIDDAQKNISLREIKFWYDNAKKPTLSIRNLFINSGKTVAIVGKSGSGKSTLLKLIMGFYENYKGTIQYGDIDIENIDQQVWFNQFSGVFQESKLFDDSVRFNIHVNKELPIDEEKLLKSIKLANVGKVIDKLPMLIDTVIGPSGMNLSYGQTQRILLARAFYNLKNVLFLDEAFNSLDVENFNTIEANIRREFADKTKIIVTHDVKTLHWVDYVYTLKYGFVIEHGTYKDLIEKEGYFYSLMGNK